MKRTALKRRTPLARRVRLRQVGSTGRARAQQRTSPKLDWIRRHPCDICGRDPYSDPDHEPTVGAAGWHEQVWPLCRKHHTEKGTLGRRTFESRYNVNITERVSEYSRRWEQLEGINAEN